MALLARGLSRHQHHRDMLSFFIFQGLVLLVSFYLSALFFQALADGLGFTSVSDTATLPLLILVFGLMGLVMTPLTAFCHILTSDHDSFISAMAKLTEQNLTEGEPPRWVETLLDDHPSYRQGVAMAQRFKTSR